MSTPTGRPVPDGAPLRVVMATAADADVVASIYAPIVRDTAISLEDDSPDSAEMRRRIEATLPVLPWLVCRRAGEVLGYADAGPHRSRAGYRWSVDVSAYVAAPARGLGVGRRLYAALLDLLTEQGYANAYAGVTLPNPASVGLHEALGFARVGVYAGVGYKLGAWRDVGWYHRRLLPGGGLQHPPAEPVRLDRLAPRLVEGVLSQLGSG